MPCLIKLFPAAACCRALSVLSLGSLAGPSLAQVPHRFTYTAVVPVAGASQAELLLRARAWARQVTPASLAPVSTSGPDTEVMQTTGMCPFAYAQANPSGKTFMATLRYNATLSLRAGRYKYEVTGFVFGFPGAGRYPASEIPVESFFNDNVKPLHACGFRYNMTMRTCYTEIADEVLARLQEGMRRPISKVGTE